MCFVVIVLGKAVYFFSPLPLSKSRLAVMVLSLMLPLCVSSRVASVHLGGGITVSTTTCKAGASIPGWTGESSMAPICMLLNSMGLTLHDLSLDGFKRCCRTTVFLSARVKAATLALPVPRACPDSTALIAADLIDTILIGARSRSCFPLFLDSCAGLERFEMHTWIELRSISTVDRIAFDLEPFG